MSSTSSIISALTPPERRAVHLIELLLWLHNTPDGEGLFTGKSRYSVLENRTRLAAERSRTVRDFYDILERTIGWSVASQSNDEALLALIAPADDDIDVLRALAERTQSIIMIARSAHRGEKAARKETARAIALEAQSPGFIDDLGPPSADDAPSLFSTPSEQTV